MKKTLVLALLALAYSGASHAVSVDTTGQVVNQCTFTSVTAGEFGSNVIDPTKLSTSHVGGTGGSVNFTYTGQPTLTIQGPASFSEAPDLGDLVPTFAPAASSSAKGSLTFTGDSATTQYTSGSSDQIDLGLVADTGSEDNFPAGDYTAATVLTCI